LAAHLEEFLDGFQEMSNCCCLPGKAGGTPDSISPSSTARNLDSLSIPRLLSALRGDAAVANKV
jgi:hypothetical protein